MQTLVDGREPVDGQDTAAVRTGVSTCSNHSYKLIKKPFHYAYISHNLSNSGAPPCQELGSAFAKCEEEIDDEEEEFSQLGEREADFVVFPAHF